jgi:hypothetical protein
MIKRASLARTSPHHLIKIAAALKNRSGKIVNVYSNESKHAKVPK